MLALLMALTTIYDLLAKADLQDFSVNSSWMVSAGPVLGGSSLSIWLSSNSPSFMALIVFLEAKCLVRNAGAFPAYSRLLDLRNSFYSLFSFAWIALTFVGWLK